MIAYLIKRPMLISALGCCVLSVCAFYSVRALFAAAVIFSVSLGFAIFYGNKGVITAFLLIMFSAFSCFAILPYISDLESFEGSQIEAKAVFYETTYKSENGYRSEIEIINSNALENGTRLELWHKPLNLNQGEIVKVNIKINNMSANYKGSNYSKGIYLSGSALSINRTDQMDTVLSAVGAVRRYIKNSVFKNMSYDSAATVCALIFGERDYFTDGFYDNVKGAGVAHVMVVSGMHLSILVSMALKYIEKFIYSPVLRGVVMFTIVVILAALCGFTMSVLRAGVTYIIMAISLLLNKPYSGDNALGFAVTTISIVSPFAIFSVGFQLSALSTFGILAVGIPVCSYLESRKLLKQKFIKYISEAIIICLCALLLTMPVIIYVFGYVSTVSIITNLLISYPVTLCLSLAVIGLIMNLIFPFLAQFLFFCTDGIAAYINKIINIFGSQPFSVVKVPSWCAFASVGINIFVFWILLTCKRRIDMLKLKEMNVKIINERGRKQKWQSFMRTR